MTFKFQQKCEMDQVDGQLLVNLNAGVLWLTLNQPDKRNALSHGMYDAMQQVLRGVQNDPDVGCVVIAGAGDSFCAGGDVSRMNSQWDEGAQGRIQSMRERTQVIELLQALPQPTIAMMRGFAVGAGLSLALACDLRYGDSSVVMRTGFLPMGLSGDYGVHHFLPRVVGPAKARELLLLSPRLNAEAALKLGLLNDVLPANALQASVQTLANGLASGPQPATRLMKANWRDGLDLPLDEVLNRECSRHVECAASADHREAVVAFREKRTPQFKKSWN